MYCVYISGPSVVGANSAAVTSDAFGGTASLIERLARPLTTTSATSSAGKERKGLSEKVSSAMLILFTDNQGTSFDWAYNFSERLTFRVIMTYFGGRSTCLFLVLDQKRNFYMLCLPLWEAGMMENEPLFNLCSDKLDKLQLAVGINVLTILSSDQLHVYHFEQNLQQSEKCCITLQIHHRAIKINYPHFLTACCCHFTSTTLWLCSEVFDNVYMCFKSTTVSV